MHWWSTNGYSDLGGEPAFRLLMAGERLKTFGSATSTAKDGLHE